MSEQLEEELLNVLSQAALDDADVLRFLELYDKVGMIRMGMTTWAFLS